MRQEVGPTENLALSEGSAGVRNGKVSDFKRVGQAESKQRLGQHLTTPSNPNQAREDQQDDWHADPFEGEECAGATSDQAEQEPQQFSGEHRDKATPVCPSACVDREPGAPVRSVTFLAVRALTIQ